MIFSKGWGNFESNMGYLTPGVANLICVYQGVQPSMEDYVTNYNSSYNFSSPNILQVILKYIILTPTSLVETDIDSSYYTQGLKSFRAGIATWASTFRVGFNPTPHPDGYYFLSDLELNSIQSNITTTYSTVVYPSSGTLNNSYLPGFISIVPVTNMTDNGVIKFRSIEFNDPDESDEDRAIDMSIVTSIDNNQE